MFIKIAIGGIMFTTEHLIDPTSEYYIYTPTAEAVEFFLYPLCLGHFRYLPGYHLERSSYNSLLIMSITGGSCRLRTPDTELTVSAGHTILLNCYAPHSYKSEEGWEADWIHVDGAAALKYYESLSRLAGTAIPLLSHAPAGLSSLTASFSNGTVPSEAAVSLLIAGMLSEFSSTSASATDGDIISTVTGYIQSHFAEPLSVDDLAALAHLSRFYFIRLFRQRTGQTPHEYLIATRLNHAKYLLKNTDLTVKEICFSCGFADESRFCTCFKNSTGLRPSDYRS